MPIRAVVKNIQPEDILDRREKRSMQLAQLVKLGYPVVSFSLNIPGSKKTSGAAVQFANTVLNHLARRLKELDMKIVKSELDLLLPTGPEWRLSIKAGATRLKELCRQIEEQEPWGRALDLDVIDIDGRALSRDIKRRCFLCDDLSSNCRRLGRHSESELADAAW